MIDGPLICTASGEYVNILEPWSFTPRIEDIAHALSNLCRFTGHTRVLYSVAQHSWLVSEILPDHLKLHGLLHDASEAYLGDVSRVLKHSPLLYGYRIAERNVQTRINAAFGLPGKEPAEVKAADLRLLTTERRDLLPPGPDWKLLRGVEPLEQRIEPWTPQLASLMFIARFNKLTETALAAAA